MIESNTMVETGMKVITQRDELAQKLGVVARAVSTRASVQILSGVLLRGEAGRLHLAATDMELSLRSSVAAQVDGEGSVVVPGRLLVDLVRLLPDNEVTIEYRPDENVVHVTSGSSTSTLHTYAAEDFPRLPDLDAVGTFTVERQSLLDTVSRVSRSASPRRVPTGADGDPRPVRGREARDGCDRLVPPVGEGDGAQRRGAGTRGDHSRRAHSASSHASRSPATTSSSACTRTRSSSPRTTCG